MVIEIFEELDEMVAIVELELLFHYVRIYKTMKVRMISSSGVASIRIKVVIRLLAHQINDIALILI